MGNKIIYLSPPHMSGLEEKYIAEAFVSNWVAPLGPHVNAFEQDLAQFVGLKGAVALSSGTAALHLALKYFGINQGDRVFCSSLTFAASCNPILYEKGVPVFIDSEPDSWNMSPVALERALVDAKKEGNIPKAIIVVNLYGQSADMDPIMDLSNQYGVPIIEDSAESLGATYKGRASGSFGKFGVFSFNGNKIITTSGGGALVSDDVIALEKIKFWATQARDKAPHYQHSELGYNYRLSNILAGIGRAQLSLIEDRIRLRRAVFERYYSALSHIEGIKFMPEAPYGFSNRWLTTMTVDYKRCGLSVKQIMERLAEENIESRPVWKPMHLQPLYQDYRYYPHYTYDSVSDRLFKYGICLPSGSNLTIVEQQRVIDIIIELFNDLSQRV